ncbi:hypothetical protein BGZ96_003234 [Linnemannia gamsii]|uniref:J domain-containing protein n=1 Tax=Linnemannia gamsii TaxID=64522 RepID=A0ABQ7JJJ7_9FUNG|nr:hypothetical protein BGZ96_003234 [Linnemannia gamsii]
MSSSTSSSQPAQQLHRRYLTLLGISDVGAFNRAMGKTITNNFPENHIPAQSIQTYLTQQYHNQNRNRDQIVLHLQHLIVQHSQTSTSEQASPSPEAIALYIAEMKLKASNMLGWMYLSQFPNHQATMPSGLSSSQQKFWSFLTFMGTGEWDAATSILA